MSETNNSPDIQQETNILSSQEAIRNTNEKSKRNEIPHYPTVTITNWMDKGRGYGFATTEAGEKVYIHGSNAIGPTRYFNLEAAKENPIIEVGTENPATNQQKRSIEIVWGAPSFTEERPITLTDEGKVYALRDKGEKTLLYIPENFDTSVLDMGAVYKIESYQSAGLGKVLLREKIQSEEDYEKESSAKEKQALLDAYNEFLDFVTEKQMQAQKESLGEVPQELNLKRSAMEWEVTIEGQSRRAKVDRITDKLIVLAKGKNVKGTTYYNGSVDDFGDGGQAIGGGNPEKVQHTKYIKTHPALTYNLPKNLLIVLLKEINSRIKKLSLGLPNVQRGMFHFTTCYKTQILKKLWHFGILLMIVGESLSQKILRILVIEDF